MGFGVLLFLGTRSYLYIFKYIYLCMSMLYVFVLHFMQEIYTNIDALVLFLFFNAMMYVYVCSLVLLICLID